MLFEIFHVLIWIAAAMLAISGIDDLYVDLMYWVLKRRHRASLPDFSEMYDKPEKPIAIILGAWNESGVIGRTLSFAVKNLRYSNYRIFVGVYPNDRKTIDVVSKISETDRRVKMVINPQDGPTTKADNLNNMYTAVCDFEKQFGEFEILLVHDAEDFIHPRSLKLYNFLIGYRGYHGIQIPVVPIKSNLGNMIHRTYCDAFAETHTKDMIIRQEMKTFMPFSGTGMGFHRKSMYCIEKQNSMKEAVSGLTNEDNFKDRFGRNVETTDEYFGNTEKHSGAAEYFNNTKYTENPFETLNEKPSSDISGTKRVILAYTAVFIIFVLSAGALFVYAGSSFNGTDNSVIAGVTKETNTEAGRLSGPAKSTAAKEKDGKTPTNMAVSLKTDITLAGGSNTFSKNKFFKY
ncbi:MAG: glycosyltransferase [Bacteroidetes bacterium]|nr:glycosyltransferase [Bacteroidota bacterium]